MSGGTAMQPTIELGWLLAGLVDAPRVRVRDLTLDSRSVRPGDAFVAVAGRSTHGLEHVSDAVARGAAAILYDPTDGRSLPPTPASVVTVAVPGLAPELGDVADRFYGEPSVDARVVGITGTNGKTTSAWLYALCHGRGGGYLGTLGEGRPPHLVPTHHTTSDVIAVHRALRSLVDGGAREVAMEVSSHALDQGRLAGVRLPLAAFTNLTRDHLDYHGTMAAYGAAKERLFRLAGLEHAVINVGDPWGREIAARLPSNVELTRVQVLAEAPNAGRFVVATDVECRAEGLQIRGTTHGGPFTLRSPLVGDFNAENLLIVLGLLLAGGTPLAAAVEALEAAVPPPGRMEAFSAGSAGPTVVVDYAHTPDALAKVLAALRSHTRGRLWCVFGCGGDRDRGKRPLMAAAAEAGADRIVITDDNPRSENPADIIDAIAGGLSGRVPAAVVHDRAAAIRGAAAEAVAGDVILVAGKGHEDYQIYGHERRAYSDRDVARSLAGCGL